jgi:hypothetical protein
MARSTSIHDSEVFRAVLTTVRTYADGVTPPTTTTAVYGPYSGSKGARQAVTRYSGEKAGIGSTATTTGVVEFCPVHWRGVKDAGKPTVVEDKPTGPAFVPWPKTPRLFKGMTITEKIDGTNAAIHIVPGEVEGTFSITAQSRNRVITPGKGTDNSGFAAWAHANASELALLLGPGLHFGEWWGQGINRNYGVDGRRFSLFNTDKHAEVKRTVGGVDVEPVPVLFRGDFSTTTVAAVLAMLKSEGSLAAPGFNNPEGVCVFHHGARQVTKVTLDNNDAGKWENITAF